MEYALYDPAEGYYASGEPRLGRQGDYYTASDVGRAFGRCVARQLIEFDSLAGPLDPFDVLEFGAGRGLLARDVLDAAASLDPGFAGRLRYVMVDRSPAMREVARRNAPEAEAVSPDELSGGRRGAVLAVELFDALPVRRVRRKDGALLEVRVGLDDQGRLVEAEREASGEIREAARERGAARDEETEAEIAMGTFSQLERMAAQLERGLMLIVDYGDQARDLYSRPRGTLLAYHRHSTSEEYFERVGQQDLTAHVDFSFLERAAGTMGLDKLALTTQDRFLIANGILETFEAEADQGQPGASEVKRRLQAMQLIHPEGMGRIFKVLALSKGCRPAPVLDGLKDPFAR